MDLDLSAYPALSREQVGHLRHFYNLVSQVDGEWHHMGSQEPAQEFLDAYRYQIATMAYGTAAAHYHHQPVLRSVYKSLFRRLIHKMLLRAVWGYWFNASHSGTFTNPSLTELRKPWADPVVRENIMYSGHLLLMVSLYAMLFDDDEFEREDSIVFDWNILFWGLGPERFSYNARSLQEAILKEMARTQYVGVCCEPNMVFVVCNQFPIIAIRYNDVRHGTKTVDDLLPKYIAAWEKKGMVGPGSLYPDAWLEQQDITIPAFDVGWTAWANAWMHSWRSDFVASLWEKQSLGYITTFDGQVQLNPHELANTFRDMVSEKGAPPNEETYTIAKNKARNASTPEAPKIPYTKPTFGYVAQWLSELGRPELDGLLEYADEHLKPTWENGGLFYERNDQPYNEDLRWTHMDPFSGNSAIAYARLNVAGGQKKMWEAPWTAQTLRNRPWIDGIDLGQGVDFLRAVFDEDKGLLLLTARSWDGAKRTIKPVVKNLPSGMYAVVTAVGSLENRRVESGEELALDVEVDGQELDIVVQLQK